MAAELREVLGEDPSFVAFEGYDTAAVLSEILRKHGTDRTQITEAWPRVDIEATRGRIQFSRLPGIGVWQWAWPPVQVVDREPTRPENIRVLYAS